MNIQAVEPIVNAVLYEGYILYPYRSTSNKNRQRWTFGGVYPRFYYDVTGGADPCKMQAQCLIAGNADALLEVRVRFLQPVARVVGELLEPLQEWPQSGWLKGHEPEFVAIPSLNIGDKQYHTWQEAVEREVILADHSLGELWGQGMKLPFDFDARRELEPIKDDAGLIKGILLRDQIHLRGHVELQVESISENIYRLAVRIENHTPMDSASVVTRDQASLYSFASTHIILGVRHGSFISLMDPPEDLKDAAFACDNLGCYPVLVGPPGSSDTLLCSPITLYDHPEIAAESPGDLYDGTEIDEILSLNILAMTDDEKREMAATDPRAAAMLARTEALNGDDFLRMHGVVRNTDTATINSPVHEIDTNNFDAHSPLEPPPSGPKLAYYNNGSAKLRVGDRVRLRLKAGGDIWDLVLDGKTAVIESIEQDFENKVHVAVAIDDDPGREWGLEKMPGHRFFFSPEELESLHTTSHEVRS